MQIPEHVTLCDQCGSAPVHDMTIPKWVFEQAGECFADCDCEPTEDVHVPADIDDPSGLRAGMFDHWKK